ncbi:hypothetical protein [Lysobacter enzymogenes]|uniref:Uncharacterized protein n=1 Tax=Lysobacter enzymogenes TaxID=69 RepID=A0AAU9AN54_LYSEN|nr:hypothetical protein [Lysobacter enzymogenes]BAW00321.1 conserved hypothetical protein [Lysobacter enzymogenes]
MGPSMKFPRITAIVAAVAVCAGLALAYAARPDSYGADAASDPTVTSLPRRQAGVADLTEYPWQVQLATRADGNALALLQADAIGQVRLDFSDRSMRFSGGANTLSMDYRIDGARIVSAHGDAGFAMTLAGTSQERPLAMDDLLSAHLRPPFDYWLEGSGAGQRLYLTGADGTRFVLQTRDAAYGAKGEDVSLEAEAGLRACTTGCSPNLPRPDCLSVRKLRWVKYMPQPASDWFLLPRHAFDGRRPEGQRRQLLSTRHYPSLTGKSCSLGIYVIATATDFDQLPRVEAQGNTISATVPPPAQR